MSILKMLSSKHLKMGGAALLAVKVLGIGKTLALLAGGIGGYVLAMRMHDDDEEEMAYE